MKDRRVAPAAAIFALACGLSGGCSRPQSPPKLPLVAAQPVALPTPPVPTDPTLFAYLHIRDPIPLVQQAGGGQILQKAVERGVKIADFKSGEPLLAFLWDPQGASLAEVPAVVLAPLPTDGDLVGLIKTTGPAVRAAAVGAEKNLTAFTLGDAAQERVKTGGAELLALVRAKQPFDAMLHVNAAAIMAKYGPVLHAGIQAMGPTLALAAAQNRSAAAPSPKGTIGMLDQMVSGLEDLTSFTLGANLTETELTLSTLTAVKGAEAGGSQGGPITAPDLAQFVPPGDLKLQWSTRELKKSIDWYLRIYGGFLAEKPELKRQIDEAVGEWLKAGQSLDTAASVSFGGGKAGFSMHGLMRVDNGPAAMAALRRSMQMFSAGPVHDLYKSMGIELSIKRQLGVRKLKGNPVDRYEYSFQVSGQGGDKPAAEPALKAMLDKLSGLSYEVMQAGPYLVYALGAPLEPVVEPLFDGKGPYPMAARQSFPAGGSLYLELDLAAVLRWMKSLVPPEQALKLPSLPARGSTISAWSYDGGAVSYQQIRIPDSILKSLTGTAPMF